MEYESGVLWGSFQYVINYEIIKYLLKSFIYSNIALLMLTRSKKKTSMMVESSDYFSIQSFILERKNLISW